MGYELDFKDKNGHLKRRDELDAKGSREWNTMLLEDRPT